MKSRVIVILLFVGLVGAQWFIPFQMIQESRTTLTIGKEYKFKIAPFDPEDPFRGKYLNLEFEANQIAVSPPPEWEPGETVYVIVNRDVAGYARIEELSKGEPVNGEDYIKSTIRTVRGEGPFTIHIDYPFDRYYINERLAESLEKILTENQKDDSRVNYAQVRVKAGQALLEEVYIDEISVKEWYDKVHTHLR